DAADAVVTQQQGKGGRDRLRIGLDGDLRRRRERVERADERFGLREGGRATSHEHRLERAGENPALAVELREKRVDVAPMLLAAAHGGDEVAVAAAMRAEWQVDVQMADAARDPGRRKTRGSLSRGGHFFFSPSRFRTARNASCGTSTPPTCFIRFLPFFCFSSSFRLRQMSPP